MEDLNLLDDHIENKELVVDAPIFPIVMQYGIMGSFILILILTLQYSLGATTFNEEFSLSFIIYIFSLGFIYLAYIGMMIYAIIHYKKTNDGFASFGKAFVITFLTGLMMAVLSMIFSLIMMFIFGFPSFGLGELNGLNNVLGDSSAMFVLMLISSLSSLFFGCMAGAIVALIISAITKNERPIGFKTY